MQRYVLVVGVGADADRLDTHDCGRRRGGDLPIWL